LQQKQKNKEEEEYLRTNLSGMLILLLEHAKQKNSSLVSVAAHENPVRIQFTLLSQRSMTNVCQKALPLGLLKGRKEGRKEGDPHDSRGFLVIKIGICDDFLRLKLLKKSGLDFFNR
jgi:hypothetical protein